MTQAVLPQPHSPPLSREAADYSLIGENSRRAVERGLAEADWYQCDVPRETMNQLLARRNGPAIRDTIIWFALIIGLGALSFSLWGTWWFLLPYAAYAALYASTSDSRWHESSHGTAFRSDWMNNALYEVASFMVMRESVVWRWSHNRHHSDTIILGRDPEIVVQRPPHLVQLLFSFTAIQVYPGYFSSIVRHSWGVMTEAEKTFIPETEFSKVYSRARIYVLLYASVVGLSIAMGSILPLLYVGLVNLFGSWLMPIYGYTQHAGLQENVLDHRLNCRTVHMSLINRFLYWNMGYHVEHHMFPLVPYHALPKLHAAVAHDMPKPYASLLSAWKEIIPAVIRQSQDPSYFVERKLPVATGEKRDSAIVSDATPDRNGWVNVCDSSALSAEATLRFDHGKKTYALFRDADGCLFALDGICTHGHAHLADGLVHKGTIECPKHNGRFRLKDGEPARAPVCRGLATYPVEAHEGKLRLNVLKPGGAGAREVENRTLEVKSSSFLTPFIKEIVLQPAGNSADLPFEAGDYIQVHIPEFERLSLRNFDLPEEVAQAWEVAGLTDLTVSHQGPERRNNYSLASNSKTEPNELRLNVRLATPPPNTRLPPGVGSSYMFSLAPGDQLNITGPEGDFHIKPTEKEIVYIGGGAGMAPIRAHLSELFESQATKRKVSFFYGARSRRDMFYQEFLDELARRHPNFTATVALSEPQKNDNWEGPVGYIHETAREYLELHPNPRAIEYYLCGPPALIAASTELLVSLGVERHQIAFDEF